MHKTETKEKRDSKETEKKETNTKYSAVCTVQPPAATGDTEGLNAANPKP